MKTEGDKDVFIIRQAYALRECDLKRAGAVALTEFQARARKWWPW